MTDRRGRVGPPLSLLRAADLAVLRTLCRLLRVDVDAPDAAYAEYVDHGGDDDSWAQDVRQGLTGLWMVVAVVLAAAAVAPGLAVARPAPVALLLVVATSLASVAFLFHGVWKGLRVADRGGARRDQVAVVVLGVVVASAAVVIYR